jgi:hypothetical protein
MERDRQPGKPGRCLAFSFPGDASRADHLQFPVMHHHMGSKPMIVADAFCAPRRTPTPVAALSSSRAPGEEPMRVLILILLISGPWMAFLALEISRLGPSIIRIFIQCHVVASKMTFVASNLSVFF